MGESGDYLIKFHNFNLLMFLGEYKNNLGDKNRIAVPKKLRDQFNGALILTRGYEGCLLLVDYKRWNFLLEQINRKALLSLSVRDTKRYIIGGALNIDLDSQGRFVLPESLKMFANIENEVIFLGVGEWIEIWNSEKWSNKLKYLSENVSDLAEKLSEIKND
ncbi:MAG: division/cell wall cluster transcriptional repressor MraZ [Candidatus Dojkabacteria bacterium]|nr:division/cell wall cluster transcriptional repressor MraZ [Candidatus Dojkabacteria bacterium]MDQ7021520.1 division/cell wall cluster transcriptional repressor MraZ [Candidatus Dojkabacteria bacterium]